MVVFSELSKKLAAEWSNLTEDDKLKYNEIAKKDKERYDREFAEYQTTEQYKNYLESQKEQSNNSVTASPAADNNKKKKKKTSSGPTVREERGASLDDSDGEVTEPVQRESSCNSFDVPIFTEEFLDHNKARELELKQLRKQTGEFEEQNAVLGKHIESMKSAISKLEVDTVQQRQSNAGKYIPLKIVISDWLTQIIPISDWLIHKNSNL